MGKGKSVTIGYRYRLGFHLVLCQGGADAIIKIRYEDRVAWSGNVTSNQSVTINQPNLFGGDKKQGGLQGTVEFLFGGETQPVSSYLAYHSNKTVIPAYLNQFNFIGGVDGWSAASGGTNSDIVTNGGIPVPAYRGVVSLLFKKFMYGAMNPYLKPFRVTVRRIPKTLGTTNATITLDGRQHANPAHMIYDILTNKQWGQGLEDGDINVASFTTAAATLASEGFGLSMLWKQESTADDFINLILSHISATLFPDPSTGQYTLKLMRNDYDINSLTELNESSILALRSYQRASTNDLTNELTVEYYEPENEQEAKITVQNLATLRSVGKIVRRVIQYPGIRNAALAARVAQRDLLAFSTPLAKLSLETNLSAWNLRPGDVFKFSWSKLGITSVVFRILEIEYGGLRDNKIVITAVEDIFAVPTASYIGAQAVVSQTVANNLSDLTTYKIFDAPHYSLIQYFGEDYNANLSDNRNFVSVIAPRSNGLWTDFKLHELVSGSYVERDAGSFAPFVSITSSMTELQTSVGYTGYFDLELVTPPVLGVIDNEWVSVDGINTTTKTLTLKRGVLDSIPATHAGNALLYIYGENFLLDEDTERFAGETVTYKFQPRTGSEELPLANATARGYTVNGRQQRPYPPGNVRLNGSYYPASLVGSITVTWAHRDRTLQTASPVSWTNGNIGPEAGVTYTVTYYQGASATQVHQATGITNTSYVTSPGVLGANSDLRVEVKSTRSGVDNFQTFAHRFTWTPGPVGTGTLSSQSAATSGSGLVANSSTGAGALVAQSATVSGTGSVTDVPNAITGTGVLAASAATVAGTGAAANIVLQLRMDGTNGSTTFIDDTGKTVTAVNSAQISTAQTKHGSAVGSFPGGDSYLRVTNSTDFAFGTGDFTVECWVYMTSTTSWRITNRNEWGGQSGYWGFTVSPASNTFYFSEVITGEPRIESTSVTFTLNQWMHLAAARSGNTLRLFVNGTEVASGTFTNSLSGTAWDLKIGISSPGASLNGYLDDVRIAKGTAIYTANFTPPGPLANGVITGTGALSAQSATTSGTGSVANVVLLLRMNGANGSTTFTDETGKIVSRYGNAQISTAQSPSGSGSSGLFDGNGDYLTVADSADFDLGAGDYTVEAWVYPTSSNAMAIDTRTAPTNTVGAMIWGVDPGVRVVVYRYPTVYAFSDLVPQLNRWSHVAIVRQSGVLKAFLNGVQSATTHAFAFAVSSTTMTVGTNINNRIGENIATSWPQGHIDDVRIVKDRAMYTDTFVPPPPFGVTNVVTGAGAMASGLPTGNRTTTTGWAHTGDPDLSLSMQGSNGSTVFTDTSPNALAFTVNGNAQISTAESPFAGGSSGAFDGNGDFLSLTNVPAALRLDTTDFTIEFWVRTSSTGTQAILGNLNDNLGTGHYWVMLNSTYIALHTLQFGYEGTAHRFGTTTLPLNQWVHFALVRSTNSLKCYQDGVQIGSIGSMSSNFTGTTSNPFRIGAANPGTSGNSYFLNGYLAGVRITKAEVYRGSFTPTGPFA